MSRSGPLGGLVWSAERLRRCHGPVCWEAWEVSRSGPLGALGVSWSDPLGGFAGVTGIRVCLTRTLRDPYAQLTRMLRSGISKTQDFLPNPPKP